MPDDPGESSVIQALLDGRPHPPPVQVEVDAGDDAAVLPGGLVVTVDAMVEGVHWDDRLSAADVGWKLLAVSVSDLAAMGAQPAWATLSASLPRPLDLAWAQGLSTGLGEACARWGVHLVGGDVTRSPGPRVLSLTLGGHAAGPVTRGGARPGDHLWVSGVLGEASLGFARGGPSLRSLRRPQPPLELALDLARDGLVTAMMDLSDGLAADLPRLCAASDVAAVVDAASLPCSEAVRADPDALALMTAFGEDYELLFTAPPLHAHAIEALSLYRGHPVTRVGRIEAGAGARLSSGPWPAARFSHFGAAAAGGT